MENKEVTTKFDFGFTHVSEEEMFSDLIEQKEEEIEEIRQASEARVLRVKNMIAPLLDKLVAETEKEYIYWPNREHDVNEFRKRLDKV